MSERLDRLNRECYGMRYLRNVLRSAITQARAETKATDDNPLKIMVHDGEERHFYSANETGVREAARWALEIDGAITIRIHRITLRVMYDGPYDRDNREEIIADHNERAGAIINTLDENGRNLADGGIHRIL